MLHLGYKLEDATSHEVDGGNNDDEAMPCSVGQDYLAISFTDYRCNGRSLFTSILSTMLALRLINLDRRYCRREPYTKTQA